MTDRAATDVMAMVFAHQGGWDEILLVAGPILALAGLLFVADRRARRMRQDASDTHETPMGDETG